MRTFPTLFTLAKRIVGANGRTGSVFAALKFGRPLAGIRRFMTTYATLSVDAIGTTGAHIHMRGDIKQSE